MALPKSYLTTTKNLNAILQAIQGAPAPEKFTTRFLAGLGFTSVSDRPVIGVLKSLGFLDSEGKPQDRYFRYLDQTQSEIVLAEGIRDAYSDLFKVKTDAQNFSSADVTNKTKTLTQGSMSEAVLKKFSATFTALTKLADFTQLTPDITASDNESGEVPISDSQPNSVVSLPDKNRSSGKSLGGLHYNIQIILPATRDTAIYDAIFKSLKDHLID